MSVVDGHRNAGWPEALTDQELAKVLRELAEEAAGDVSHDFGTVLDIYNDRHRMAGEGGLSQAACQQIISAVRLSIPGLGRPSVWRSDLLVVNRHLFHLLHGRSTQAGCRVLPGLLRTAADCVEGRRSEPGSPNASASGASDSLQNGLPQ